MLKFDESTVRKSIQLLHGDKPFEIRVLGGKYVNSGIFTNIDSAITALKMFRGRGNVYITINSISNFEDLEQVGKLCPVKQTISDTNISSIDWLFIDFDPVRKSNTSSNDNQLKASEDMALRVKEYMLSLKFSDPIFAMSGNGYHLMYKVNNCTSEHIKATLSKLDSMYSDDIIKVDTSNGNSARICKLWGTESVKGKTHRVSNIISAPDVVQPNDVTLLNCIIEDNTVTPVSKEVKPFVIQDDTYLKKFCAKNNITVTGYTAKNGIAFYHLDCCLFNPEHGAKADITRTLSGNYKGSYGYHCYHEGCKGKNWKDVKELFIKHLNLQTFKQYCQDNRYNFAVDYFKHQPMFFGFDMYDNGTDLTRAVPISIYTDMKKLEYNECTQSHIKALIQQIYFANEYNPLAELIDNTVWDKVDRLERLYTALHINKTDKLSRVIIKKWLKQCYNMLHNTLDCPVHNNFALIFTESAEDVVSPLLEKLAILEGYYGHGIIHKGMKEYRNAVKYWICQLSPLTEDNTSLYSIFRQRISTNTDDGKIAYETKNIDLPIKTVFVGTSKERFCKPDDNTHFATVPLSKGIDYSIINTLDIEQLWAQIKASDISCDFTDEEREQLLQRNELYTPLPPGFDIICSLLENLKNADSLEYIDLSASEFKQMHINELLLYTPEQIGVVLNRLGYERNWHRVNKTPKVTYNLPCIKN